MSVILDSDDSRTYRWECYYGRASGKNVEELRCTQARHKQRFLEALGRFVGRNVKRSCERQDCVLLFVAIDDVRTTNADR